MSFKPDRPTNLFLSAESGKSDLASFKKSREHGSRSSSGSGPFQMEMAMVLKKFWDHCSRGHRSLSWSCSPHGDRSRSPVSRCHRTLALSDHDRSAVASPSHLDHFYGCHCKLLVPIHPLHFFCCDFSNTNADAFIAFVVICH